MCKKLIVLCLTLAVAATVTSAEIIYVDATHGASGNTAIAPSAGGGVWDLPENDGYGLSDANGIDVIGSDNLWRLRTGFANPEGSGTVYEAGGAFGNTANPEDCPRLVTTVSDLPEDTYKVYVYFWSDTSQWRIRTKLTDDTDSLPLFYSRIDVYIDEKMPPTASHAVEVLTQNNSVFKVAPLFKEGNRTLWQGYLGEVTGTEIKVFIDDDPNHGMHNHRTWYDGIGYVPEPSIVTPLGLFVLALLRRKRAR